MVELGASACLSGWCASPGPCILEACAAGWHVKVSSGSTAVFTQLF